MWEQRRNRQPMMHMITPGRAVAPGYMEWFYANGKPFIMTPEARAQVLRAPRPERPRQQLGSRSTDASTHQAGGPSTSAIPGFAAQGPSTEPYTPMPLVFTHGASSQFQSPMAPPTEGFFDGAAYTPGSLFATGPSGSGHDVHDDVEADRSEEDEDALVRRNPRRNRRAPDCWTGGHRRH
ncbi:hypothetical protein V6N13_049585 [Hibiscus sabdariffa]